MIRIERVSKSYDGGATFAVDDVSLDVPTGSLTALLGASGCGKTTTLKMINRLIEPTRGRIFVGDQNVLDLDPVALRRGVGYVVQGAGLFPHFTVAENVAVVPSLLGWSPARVRARVDELLELVELPPDKFRDRFPAQLSGGQQQRVGFARALAADPAVILLDEPFGALDPIVRDQLQTALKNLQSRIGFTAVMVTHDMTEALVLADRIAVMSEGKLLQVGAPAELFARPAHPFVEALLAAPKRQAEVFERVVSPAG